MLEFHTILADSGPFLTLYPGNSRAVRWLERNGYPQPPKSSCVGCPSHRDRHWREMKDHSPDEWADAVAVDKLIRLAARRFNAKIRGEQFMHSSFRQRITVNSICSTMSVKECAVSSLKYLQPKRGTAGIIFISAIRPAG